MKFNSVLVVATFYNFVYLDNYEDMQFPLKEFCEKNKLKGTILIAEEGINASICGARSNIEELLVFLKQESRFSNLEVKQTLTQFNPFQKLKIRLKKEIVKLGIKGLKVNNKTNNALGPEEWDNFINKEDVYIIDNRNFYETQLGSFVNAIHPNTENFCDFPQWLHNWITENKIRKSQKIALYCTGGIRCEKSTVYLQEKGFSSVYQLEGGILNYLQHTQNKNAKWKGSCFVFDDRVALLENLNVAQINCVICENMLNTDELKDSTKGKVLCKRCKQSSALFSNTVEEGI